MYKFVIDGNIGSGKTTQLNLLEARGHEVFREPVEKWPLELLYSDPERWGFLFQVIVLLTTQSRDRPNIIYERCPSSSKEVFYKVMKRQPIEDRVYNIFFDKCKWFPDTYIYIHKPAELCLKHISSRSNTGDSKITLSYLKQLEDAYRVMFDKLEVSRKYWIDGSKGVLEIHKEINTIINNDRQM